MLTIALDGDKLAPMLIAQSRRAVQYNLPTAAQIRVELHSPNLQLPEIPIVLCHSASTWNNAQIHSKMYMPSVVLPKLQKCPPAAPNPVKRQQLPAHEPAPAVDEKLAAKIAAAKQHLPANKRVLGSYGKDPIGGEVHDVFSGHIADETRQAYSKHQLFTSVVAARCTGFQQWNDVHLHNGFRPPLANELRRRLRLRDSTEPLTFYEWCEMLLIAICVVWYNPEFFPPEQTQREFRELTLTLPTDGSEDNQAKVLLLSKEIDLKLLQPMTMHRLEELCQQIQAQPAEAGDVPESAEAKDEVEDDVVEAEETDEHAKTAAFRQAVKAGDQVAILVDRDEEGVPFLLGDVINISIHTPAVKKSG